MTEQEELLPIAARYTRSVHIARDFGSIKQALAGYQATPLVVQTLERICEGLRPDSTTRAFSLVGVYGTGKSAFGLFLAHYLGSHPEHRGAILASHAGTNEIARFTYTGRRLLPVLVSGNNQSLRHALLAALHHALTDVLPSGEELVCEIDAERQRTDSDPGSVAELFERATHVLAKQTDYGGTLLIIDELGQYLNYLFRHNEERDLFVLQTLAEVSARSGATPLVLLTLLHQAFDRYATTAGAAQRTEWKKVSGRFVDLPFQEPDSQMMRMIGLALCPNTTDQYAPQRQEWAAGLASHTETLGLRPAAIESAEWRRLLTQTRLLHPTVLVVLPLLFRHLAQNERSLFSFLTSSEPWSFRDVLATHQSNGTQPPIYRLPHLFAYVEATMGTGLYSRVHGRRWAELIEALARLTESDQQKGQVLTTIGTVNALGQYHRVRASKELVCFALKDTPDDPQILAIIRQMEQQQHITYRRYRDSYIIWEGSDLDLDGLLQDALRTLGDRTNVAALLQQNTRVVPMVARQHSYHTGAVRQFAVRFVAAEDVAILPLCTDQADGEILYVVPTDDEALQHTRQWAERSERVEEAQRIVVIPQHIQHINDVLLDVAALQHVLKTQPELQQDRVAHRELASRLGEAQHALDDAITWAYHPGHGEWWWCGKKRTLQTMRQLDALLYDACATIYSQAPRIWNELVVRRHLPSASSKARRNLIEAMLDHGHLDGLGLEGYSPEQTIYASVFKASGIHRQDTDGVWRFGAPRQDTDEKFNLLPIWKAMQGFLDSTHQHRKPITELFAMMEAPPYGVKAGLIPLLFQAIYLANAGEIALYEHGNYVTVPDIAVFERLMRHPNYFSLRQFQSGGVRMKVYERIASVLAPHALTKDVQPALLDAINPLLRFARKLPEYSQHTQQVSEQAQAIRRALLDAQEPDIVLFETLARACGVEPFGSDSTVEIETSLLEPFFAALRTGIIELQDAYVNLVREVATCIHRVFVTQSPDPVLLYEELRKRSHQIRETTSDTQIRAFAVRLEHASVGNAWIESVGELVARKPMTHWHDTDLDEFKIRIADLGRRFCTQEKVAVATRVMTPEARAMHISLTDTQGERSRVIWHNELDTTTEEIQSQIETVLKQQEHLNEEQRVRVLVGLLRPLLQQSDESER